MAGGRNADARIPTQLGPELNMCTATVIRERQVRDGGLTINALIKSLSGG
jgi:hypothetical protein